MKKRRYILCLTLLVLSGILQQAQSQQLQYNFRHLTPNEGLSNENVNDIIQDHYGFIWLGTSFGLNRFDGVNLKPFFYDSKDTATISGNVVMALHEDKANNIWVGCMEGLSLLDQSSHTISRYFPEYRIVEIAENKEGQIMVATTKGLKRANPTEKRLEDVQVADTTLNRLLQSAITDILYTKDDRFYIAGNFGVIILEWQTKKWQLINNQPKNGSLIESNTVERIAVDSSNRLWIATEEIYSMLYAIGADRKTSVKYDYFTKNNNQLIPNRIRGLMVDATGRLWVVSNDLGLAVYNPKQNQFTSYSNNPLQPGSLATNQSSGAIMADKSGVIWVGTSGYGVDYFHPDKMIFSTIEKVPFANVTLIHNWGRAVAEDSHKNLWFATGRGVTFYNPQNGVFKNFDSKQLHSPSIRSLLIGKDTYVWIGTADGLNKYNTTTGSMKFYTSEDGFPKIFVHTLFKTSGGKIFAGGNKGLYEYLPDSDKFYSHINNTALAAVADNVVKTITEDKTGNWWFGTNANGVYVYNPEKGKVIKRISIETTSSFSDNSIQSMLEDKKGNMWIGTRNGLNCYNITSEKNTYYGTEQGLPNTWICGLQLDNSERLWIGTGNGLCVMNTSGKIFQQFGLSDGLSSAQFNDQNAYTLSDGRFVFPTRKGFLVFNPDDFNWLEEKPQVYILDIDILGSEKPAILNAHSLNELRLSHKDNFFKVQLRGLNYLNPKQCWYSYKLDGFDKDWIVSNDPVANYTNVPPGHYIFRYKATNNRNIWNGIEKTLTIHVSNVFYNTWWFRALILVLIISGFVFFYKYRIGQKDAMQALQSKAELLEKEKAVVMYESLKQHLNPHFLFNSLTSLGSLIRFDPQMANDFLDKMSKVYRYILKNRDKETVSLGEELKAIDLYIQLQKTRFEEGLQVHINIDEAYHHRKLPPVTLQNLVENAIKHNITSPEAPLTIDIFLEDDYLVVRNNLQKKGFVESSNRQGLANMASLFQYMSSRPMQIIEDDTNFIVKIPLL